jgi:hypothetical protein
VRVGHGVPVDTVTTAETRQAVSARRRSGRGFGRSWRGIVLVAVVYAALAVLVWWQVWSSHPTTTTTCGCGDGARFLWFFEWPSYALTHGHSVFYSQWLFHPTGINLLNDTSVVALGLVLSPITLALGPVASMNVALTLAPALSALAMFVLVRRWVIWTPAAFIAGLAYGFSPFMVSELALNQLNIAFLAIPPLVVLALDELLVRQKHSRYAVGVALAVLLAVQFFVSTEVLVITMLFCVVGVAVVVAFAALRRPSALVERSSHAARGLACTVGATVVLLAYPLSFLLRGPAHLTGPIWSNGTISQYGNSFTSFWLPGTLTAPPHRFGGYQGPALPGLGYLGAGLVVVAVLGALIWWRDLRMGLFAAVGVVAAVFSLGPGHGYWVPWQAVEKVPWVGDIVEIRFTLVLGFCASVMVALTLDHVRAWLAARLPGGHPSLGPLVVWAVAVATLVPTAIVLWPNVPLTARAVVLPRWYVQVGASLPPGRVILAYPLPFSGLQSSQAWQAVNKMQWAQAGGGGPEGQANRAGTSRAGFGVLSAASLPLGAAPLPTSSNLAAIRQAIRQWQVTTIVVPEQSELPIYEQGRSSAYAVGLLTSAMGRPPVYSHSAWVWDSAQQMAAPMPMGDSAFTRCLDEATAGARLKLAVPSCILSR